MKEQNLIEMERLQQNIEKLFKSDREQREIINRLNLIIIGDKDAGVKGLVQTQQEMQSDLLKLKDIVTGGKAIAWVMSIIGVGGLIVGAKIIMALVEISEHIGK